MKQLMKPNDEICSYETFLDAKNPSNETYIKKDEMTIIFLVVRTHPYFDITRCDFLSKVLN